MGEARVNHLWMAGWSIHRTPRVGRVGVRVHLYVGVSQSATRLYSLKKKHAFSSRCHVRKPHYVAYVSLAGASCKLTWSVCQSDAFGA